MIFRILYNLWIWFWRIFFSLGIALLLLLVVAVGLLQIPQSRDYIQAEVTDTFNRQFEGSLEIGEITGFLPFTAGIKNGSIYAPGNSTEPVISFQSADVQVNLWQLVQQNLSIKNFEVNSPKIRLGFDGDTLSIAKAFAQSDEVRERSILEGEQPQLVKRINIFAPRISVTDGSLLVDQTIELPENLQLPSPFEVENLSFSIYLEVTDTQVFFDLPDFIADLPNTRYESLNLSGQFYNDDHYFELNRFTLSTNLGSADFSFEATPVNLFVPNLNQQFREADYKLQITESSFQTELVQQFVQGYPDFEPNLELELISEGTFNEYFLDRLQANIGQSSILVSAKATDLLDETIAYQAQIDNMVIHPSTLAWISDTYFENEINLERYQLSTIRGEITGDNHQLMADFQAQTEAGSILLDGELNLEDLLSYNLLFEVDSLDITPFLADTINSSVIEGRVTLSGENAGSDAVFRSRVDLSRSVLLGYNVDTFIADLNFNRGALNYSITGSDSEFAVNARGQYEAYDGITRFITEGDVVNFNLKTFYDDFHAEETSFNSRFSANLEWATIDDLTGRVSFEVEESTIDRDTLRPHQFYADINSGSGDTRILRFTSSFFDGEISGNLEYDLLTKFGTYWHAYLRERISEEILFDPDFALQLEQPVFEDDTYRSANIDIQMTIRDLSLLRMYLPDLPDLQSRAQFRTSVDVSKDRLLVTGELMDQNFVFGDIRADNFNAAFTAGFRYQNELKTSSTVDLQLSTSEAAIRGLELKDSNLNFTMRDDSIRINQRFERLEDDLKVESTFTSFLRDSTLDLVIDQLNLGTEQYNWTTEGNPVLRYHARNALEIERFILVSDSDYLEINGIYSTDFDDSVEYSVSNFDLSRVSDLIAGRIQFSGILNGDFTTQTLTQIPSIQGNLTVDNGRILDRVIGDVSLNSILNTETNRFETEIHIYTDPDRYQSYYNRNDGIGQDLLLTGYFKLPDENTDPDEDLFYFDVDLRQIDMWIVTFIIPTIMQEVEGSSSGTGFIRGSLTDYNFESTFNISDVYAKPAFMNVEYTLNGELDFNRAEGLIFRDIALQDNRNGRGTLFGRIDLDDFSPLTILDLTLDLNNLHFMNNSYDPDLPFYGSIYGTGQAQIVGTNFSPVLRTTRPLVISSDSRISIPLEPEVEFEQNRRFIQFVESFDQPFRDRDLTQLDRINGEEDTGSDLTFMELFTMDLQFQANDPITVRLIFDPVTNDILSTQGTGQMRLLLEDQDVSMFGRFNITGGEYQFVSGDIFTRRFTLQEGGSISWSGDLVDADLNVTAVYRARPSISSLLAASGSISQTDPGQRIPVDLVLQIGGTITSIENEFFFRVPTGIEGNVDPAITSQINSLNQNEDEKLIQATSILLSGNFIPASSAQGLGLAEGFSGTAAVVNPLITSQVINPLLSNQINSLLRSDMTFDIDFNLTALNEVDLGIALRLFDDRIILRREGQITGEQSDIGDIGATYRINRTFSVSAFHRQDPTLSYTSGVESRQAQEMNGIGVEAQVQFNTWQNLRSRISDAFRKLFGIKPDDHENDESDSLAKN